MLVGKIFDFDDGFHFFSPKKDGFRFLGAEVPDPNGRCSSLLSLVKAFDSVLAVYDGFCNLKQVLFFHSNK